MLTEERYKIILCELNEKNSVTVTELVEHLNTSESTIRRDLNALDKLGKLNKVHGGATLLSRTLKTKEDSVTHRQHLNMDEKEIIARYAAGLIEEDDFVYIDAGTTTELMIDYITQKKAVFITNGIGHAKKLIQKDCRVYIVGGELKITTEAIIGAEAINGLRKYNFTKGFFGANGISIESGYTTPDIKEALVKEEALKRSNQAYILSDKSKFNSISSVTFGNIKDARIITTKLEDNKFRKETEILEVN